MVPAHRADHAPGDRRDGRGDCAPPAAGFPQKGKSVPGNRAACAHASVPPSIVVGRTTRLTTARAAVVHTRGDTRISRRRFCEASACAWLQLRRNSSDDARGLRIRASVRKRHMPQRFLISAPVRSHPSAAVAGGTGGIFRPSKIKHRKGQRPALFTTMSGRVAARGARFPHPQSRWQGPR
jgi:hypothetical protein